MNNLECAIEKIIEVLSKEEEGVCIWDIRQSIKNASDKEITSLVGNDFDFLIKNQVSVIDYSKPDAVVIHSSIFYSEIRGYIFARIVQTLEVEQLAEKQILDLMIKNTGCGKSVIRVLEVYPEKLTEEWVDKYLAEHIAAQADNRTLKIARNLRLKAAKMRKDIVGKILFQ